MIGMVLVTHGKLAAEFLAALEHVVGKQQKVATVCIGAEDDMEQRRKEILERVNEVETGDGVVLLTDMFGGTPSNLAISVLDRANVEVIAGINLPMLIKLAGMREGQRCRPPSPRRRKRAANTSTSPPSCWRRGGSSFMSAGGAITRIANIRNQRGLHARAAAKFVKVAGGFNAQVRVIKGDMDVSGTLHHGADDAGGRHWHGHRAARQRRAGEGSHAGAGRSDRAQIR